MSVCLLVIACGGMMATASSRQSGCTDPEWTREARGDARGWRECLMDRKTGAGDDRYVVCPTKRSCKGPGKTRRRRLALALEVEAEMVGNMLEGSQAGFGRNRGVALG